MAASVRSDRSWYLQALARDPRNRPAAFNLATQDLWRSYKQGDSTAPDAKWFARREAIHRLETLREESPKVGASLRPWYAVFSVRRPEWYDPLWYRTSYVLAADVANRSEQGASPRAGGVPTASPDEIQQARQIASELVLAIEMVRAGGLGTSAELRSFVRGIESASVLLLAGLVDLEVSAGKRGTTPVRNRRTLRHAVTRRQRPDPESVLSLVTSWGPLPVQGELNLASFWTSRFVRSDGKNEKAKARDRARDHLLRAVEDAAPRWARAALDDPSLKPLLAEAKLRARVTFLATGKRPRPTHHPKKSTPRRRTSSGRS